jgi:hypothetical protein
VATLIDLPWVFPFFFLNRTHAYSLSKECGNAAKTIKMVGIYPAALFIHCSLVQGARQVQLEFNTSSFFDEEILVLLTKHVTDTHRTSDFIALKVEIEDDLVPISKVAENQHTLSSKVCLPTFPL